MRPVCWLLAVAATMFDFLGSHLNGTPSKDVLYELEYLFLAARVHLVCQFTELGHVDVRLIVREDVREIGGILNLPWSLTVRRNHGGELRDKGHFQVRHAVRIA